MNRNKIKYCRLCVIPSSKPNIGFSKDGFCDACLFHKRKNNFKKGINWKKRKKEFDVLINNIKKKKSQLYDAAVPVSGGKDSITQVHYLLKKKLRVLAINIDYGFKTPIGHHNLSLIPKMGASLITFRPNLKIHKKVLKISFVKYGDPDLMSHCMLHALPIKIAIDLGIPLILLGENSAFEYSGEKGYNEKKITHKWFNRYASVGNLTPDRFSKLNKINYKDMAQYNLPSKRELSTIHPVFCSYFFKWDSEVNLKIAKKYGFKTLKTNQEGTYRNYHGIDEKINRIHQYLKFLKFGYGRATDHACEDIRNKRISRKKALQLVLKYDRSKISKFFYKDFIDLIGISEKTFFQICNKFTQKNISNQIKKIK
tara:strand:+ start:737 stop:1843 length:1107 start_codon:yes stop_codon:yes gene_type:complete